MVVAIMAARITRRDLDIPHLKVRRFHCPPDTFLALIAKKRFRDERLLLKLSIHRQFTCLVLVKKTFRC